MKFYPRKWACYELAKPGTMKLCPPEERIDALRKDYDVMKDMMFEECPSFEEIMVFIAQMEKEINSL